MLNRIGQLFGGGAGAAGRAMLRAVTPEARAAARAEEIPLDHFPFRVGRESRSSDAPPGGGAERRDGATPPSSDLYLADTGKRLQVSRDHFRIDCKDDGSYELVDTGSTCGTIVDGEVLGGNREGGRRGLASGSRITVGTRESRLIYEFVV